uniref:GIY-YIG domain-containing protein n=1 Tax=viral metagenome TaxID=1070528 RepID=A0A6C0F5N9_9ZZZZ|tara:strand:- start:5671 stop:6057 length:387 start_codon:yes stop_codon:yes gene_type:complete
MVYVVYLLKNKNKSYIGMTNDFWRRWRQHNGWIRGGAKYTTRNTSDELWMPLLIIDNFKTKKEAMQCEWKLKRKKGYMKRVEWAYTLLTSHDRWTQKSPIIKSQKLQVYVTDDYKHIFQNIDTRELYY